MEAESSEIFLTWQLWLALQYNPAWIYLKENTIAFNGSYSQETVHRIAALMAFLTPHLSYSVPIVNWKAQETNVFH